MSTLVVDMTADVIDLTVEEWSTPAKELEIARPECARLYALNPWFEDGKKQADNNPNFIVNEKDGDHSVQHLYPGWKRAAESLASLSAFGGEEDVELVRKLFAAMGSSGGSSNTALANYVLFEKLASDPRFGTDTIVGKIVAEERAQLQAAASEGKNPVKNACVQGRLEETSNGRLKCALKAFVGLYIEHIFWSPQSELYAKV